MGDPLETAIICLAALATLVVLARLRFRSSAPRQVEPLDELD